MRGDPLPLPPTPTSRGWLEPPGHRWAFRNVDAVLPTRRVPAGPDRSGLVRGTAASVDDLAGLAVELPQGRTSVGEILAAGATDAWLVLHQGRLVAEHYAEGMTESSLHLTMSVTKTIVGAVVGCLCERGAMHPDDRVADHVDALAGTGYGGATVRDLLDMRSGVRFDEDYADAQSAIRRMEAAIGWRPGGESPHPGLYAFLAALVADRPHGGPFDYRSSETDVLGWICEASTGSSMADLIATHVWAPMGACDEALLVCDTAGTPVHDGGLAASARDLARFGQLLLDGGTAAGRVVLPRSWVAQFWMLDPDVRAAFAASRAAPFLPGGWYRNQAWVVPGPHGDVLLCLGIYGQLIRVDPGTATVIVKLSAWDAPQSPLLLHTLRAAEVVAGAVSGRQGRTGPRFGGDATSPSVVRRRDGPPPLG